MTRHGCEPHLSETNVGEGAHATTVISAEDHVEIVR